MLWSDWEEIGEVMSEIQWLVVLGVLRNNDLTIKDIRQFLRQTSDDGYFLPASFGITIFAPDLNGDDTL
ncbi:MAG: hypothetical protein AAB340_00135 [Patescibacteria group bacterium]